MLVDIICVRSMRIGSAILSARFAILAGFFSIAERHVKAEDTWMYAVQLSAVVQSSPPRITLNWPVDPHIATNYTVYRKTKEATSWGVGTTLAGSATNFVDANVTIGAAYEYQVVKHALQGHKGYGYIYAGLQAPLTESRGKLILMVAGTHAGSLASELARLENDLTGDGWTVIRHDVSTTSPVAVRNQIISDYAADPTNVKAVFLFGRIPVFKSGDLNYDGHLVRAMPADAFYGDMIGDWSGSPNYLPADVKLMVGRVDMFNMPGNGAAVPWPTEVELLRNYLNKDHAWRHKQIQVPRRALMGNRRGDEMGEATAASGFRNFEPLVGPGNIIEADTADLSLPQSRWGPKLAAESYLWAYGCGGGMPDGISHLGTVGEYNSLFSTNVVGQDAKAVFVMLFGSWFGEWDGQDNFMRAFLATPSYGLACLMSGRPHCFLHHMGLGETIGYGTRLSMNNNTLYQNQSNGYPRAIYVSLMGDPTLRMDMVAPPSGLSAVTVTGGVNLSWSPSSESVLGYHIYRRDSAGGSFSRMNGALITSTSYTDSSNSPATAIYMVRAVKLQTTPSGSYFNASQGIFATVNEAIQVVVRRATNGMTLTWNSRPGTIYRVLAGDSLTNWSDVSGGIEAVEANTAWTDSEIHSRRFYWVTAP